MHKDPESSYYSEKRKVLITGGAGFIGSNLADRLLSLGHKVYCLDNLITGKVENLDISHENLVFIEHNINDGIPDIPDIDIVYHLASLASPVHYLLNPILTAETGTKGTQNILEFSKNCKAKVLIASTSEIYGEPLEHPQKETYFGNLNPACLRSIYSESKRFSESLATTYSSLYDFLGVYIIRIFNTFGPKMSFDDGRVIPGFVSQALKGEPLTVFGDGSQTRTFLYIDDLIDAFLHIPDINCSSPINVGHDREMTIMELAETVCKSLEIDPVYSYFKLPDNDPIKRCPDTSKIKSLINWSPKTDLNQGLEKYIEWVKSNI